MVEGSNLTSRRVKTTHKASELFRDRFVARYQVAIDHILNPDVDIDVTASPEKYVPRASKDTALTAFAQLGTWRLNASRSFISLVDTNHQYILAESTKTLSLQSDISKELWLGSVTIPRSKGVCGLALENALKFQRSIDGVNGNDITVINDLREYPQSAGAPFPFSGPEFCFYAGAPIKSPGGVIIGVFCVFDDKPRSGLSDAEIICMKDIAGSVADHLEAVRLRNAHFRTSELITGLESFIDGLAKKRSTEEASHDRTALMAENPRELALKDVAADVSKSQSKDQSTLDLEAELPGLAPPSLWDIAMPPGAKPMFSRAANIIRQSGDYEGVAFFYIPSNQKPRSRRHSVKSGTSTLVSKHRSLSCVDENNADSSDRQSFSSDDSSGLDQPAPRDPCALLSYSLAPGHPSESRRVPFPSFQQRDMDYLIGRAPRARVYTLNRSGEALPGDSSSSESGVEQNFVSRRQGAPKIGNNDPEIVARDLRLLKRQIRSLKKLSSTALTYACLPLWDFERQRWLCYCVCWSNSPSRHLKEDGDLNFLKIFGNSIAISLSHIDAIESNRAKSTFVSSMSHELRSPLHGVLSATSFLNDGNLTRFQQEMVEVISNCGRTLLDTVDHVMDFAKISSLAPKHGHGSSTNSSLTPIMQTSLKSHDSSLSSSVDLVVLVEEVIEAVLMGFNVQHDFLYSDEDPRASLKRLPNFNSSTTSLAKTQRVVSSRGRIRLALQLPYRQSWCTHTQSGAWRRIVMNLFGNALKYTEDGIIIVRIESPSNSATTIPLCMEIVDTGKGMSKHYMNSHLYTAFSQEDEFSSGTGLGLSIVKQIIDALGGSIDINSAQGVGTSVRVNLKVPTALPTPSIANASHIIEGVSGRLRGKRVSVIEDLANSVQQAENKFSQILLTTLKQWFGVDAGLISCWPSEPPDIIICLKPLLKYFDTATKDDVVRQPVILVTYDVLELAVLRADARVAREDAVVEIMCQPLGPHKLARTLEQCLNRYEQLIAQGSKHKPPTTTAQTQILELSVSNGPPAARAASPTKGNLRRVSVELSGHPFVLIVDDNKVNLRLLSMFVKKQKFLYQEAMNGQEALEIFTTAAAGAVVLVLMDISMPVMDGMTATRRIRDLERKRNLPRTPVIALTGLTSAAARNEAYEAGMDEYLTKPLSFEQLRAFLRGFDGFRNGA